MDSTTGANPGLILVQGQTITVKDLALVLLCPQPQPMLSGFPRWIGADNVSRSYGFGGLSGWLIGWVYALKHMP